MIRIRGIRPRRSQVILRHKGVPLRLKVPMEPTSAVGWTKDTFLTLLEHLHHHRVCCCQRCKRDGNPLPRPGCICPNCNYNGKDLP